MTKTTHKIFIDRKALTDGSHVYDVRIVHQGETVYFDCPTEDDALEFARALQTATAARTLERASIHTNY